jgi:hypothetical protein
MSWGIALMEVKKAESRGQNQGARIKEPGERQNKEQSKVQGPRSKKILSWLLDS